MADETERARLQVEEFTKALERVGAMAGRTAKQFENLSPAELQLELVKFEKSLEKANTTYRKSFKSLDEWSRSLGKAQDSLEGLEEEYRKGRITEQQLQRARERYNKELSEFNRAGVIDKFSKGLTSATSRVASGLIDGTKDVLRGIQSGSDAFEIGGNVISAGVGAAAGIIGSGASTLGKTMGAAGSTIMTASLMTGNALGILGGAVLALAGGVITAFGDKLGDAAKFAVEFVKVEVQKVVKGFSEASRSGLMFADGMTGLTRAAVESGLTVEQLGSAVSRNASLLVSSGLGVGESTKLMGKALKSGGDMFRTEMLNLGYSIEEFPDLLSQTISGMSGVGGPLRASEGEILQQTREYAKHLRVIAAVTGEDAKNRQEAARRQANTLLFQQKLAQMEPNARMALRKSMESMGDAERAAFQEMVATGGHIVESGLAMLASTSPEFAKQMQEMYSAYQQGIVNETKINDIKAKYSEGIRKELASQDALGVLQGLGLEGPLKGLVDAMTGQLIESQKFTKESLEAGRAAAEKQMKTDDDLTKATNKAQVAVQNMALEIQEQMLDSKIMTKFAEAVGDVTEFILKAIKKFGESGTVNTSGRTVTKDQARGNMIATETTAVAATESRKKAEEKFGRGSEEAKTARIAENRAQAAAARAAMEFQHATRNENRRKNVTAPADSTTSTGKVVPAGEPASTEKLPQRRNGGYVNMPESGGLAMLHGKEAVVPLPDGNTIPVSLTLNPTEALNASIESGLQNIIASMPKQEVETVTKEVVIQQPAATSLNDRLVNELIKRIDDLTSVSKAANMTTAKVVDKLDESNRIQRDILTASR